MATRGETVHAESQRHGPTPRAQKRAKARKPLAERHAPHETKHAAKKASYAKESPSATGHASRKSTRSSANRAKPDTNLTLREQRRKGSAKNRFRKSRARGARVRGAPA